MRRTGEAAALAFATMMSIRAVRASFIISGSPGHALLLDVRSSMTNATSELMLGAADAQLRWIDGGPTPRRFRVELGLSIALHAALLAAALTLAVNGSLPPPVESAVETEVISARDFAVRFPPPPVPQPQQLAPPEAEPLPDHASAPPASAPPPATARPSAPDMIRPSQMLSEQALSNPRSRGLRRELGRLGEEDRIAQLCNLEAMEQIHAWRSDVQPDRLVDYARSDTKMDGRTLIAHGGAFRAARKWYEVSYQCDLDAGLSRVVGFAFKVGAAIPREDWAADNLAAVH